MDLLREPPPTSHIAQERVQPGPPGPPFVVVALALALATCAVAAYIGSLPEGPFPVETAASGNPGSMVYPLGLHAARGVSAVAAGFTVAACAFAARRLFHSHGIGLLAGAFVALDPGFLAMARLATPDMLAVGALVGALAFFLAVAPWSHWVAAALLAAAAVVDPRSLLWGIPLAFMAVLRGHIYAAPRHLGTAALQAIAAPMAGALLNLLSGGAGFALLPCQGMPAPSLLLLQAPVFGAPASGMVAAVHDPVTWFGGLGALLLLAGGAAWSVVSQVRVARLPGRLQLRLGSGLSGTHGRVLWLLALALLVPFGTLWLVVFAIALAAGIGELAEDAPGFGVTVGLVVLVFAVLALVRAWPLVHGAADLGETATNLVPWVTLTPCGG